MKHWLNFGVAGVLMASLPALALAQTTPQTTPPQTTPPQTNPQTMPQRQNMQKQRNMPMQSSSGTAQKEVAIAHTHALMAENAQTVDKVHEHLHHVINCLEGPTGSDFKSQMENPCKGKGEGALPDSRGNSSRQNRLHQAVSQAKQGLNSDDLNQAQADARRVANLLRTQSSRGISSDGVH